MCLGFCGLPRHLWESWPDGSLCLDWAGVLGGLEQPGLPSSPDTALQQAALNLFSEQRPGSETEKHALSQAAACFTNASGHMAKSRATWEAGSKGMDTKRLRWLMPSICWLVPSDTITAGWRTVCDASYFTVVESGFEIQNGVSVCVWVFCYIYMYILHFANY